jgi:hypothetical protein
MIYFHTKTNGSLVTALKLMVQYMEYVPKIIGLATYPLPGEFQPTSSVTSKTCT